MTSSMTNNELIYLYLNVALIGIHQIMSLLLKGNISARFSTYYTVCPTIFHIYEAMTL